MEYSNMEIDDDRENFFAFFETLYPNILSNSLGQGHIDEDIYEEQIKVLCAERTNMDHSEMMEYLDDIDLAANPNSNLCDRLFEAQDVIYQCLDCGQDNTCVMCSLCFEHSEHKNHNYRLSKSGGGGCCDCGDPEAWKDHHACSVHEKSEESPSPDDDDKSSAVNIVKEEEQESALQVALDEGNIVPEVIYFVMDVIRFCTPVLGENETHSFGFSFTKLKESQKRSAAMDVEEDYCVMVYNDEIHNFDEVHRAFEAIGLRSADASESARVVDENGRACVFVGPMDECEVKRKILEDVEILHNQIPLRVVVMTVTVFMYQLAAYHFAEQIIEMAEVSTTIRSIMLQEIMNVIPREADNERTNQSDATPLDLFVRGDLNVMHWWKDVRTLFCQFYLRGLSQNTNFRMKLCEVYCNNYEMLAESNRIEIPKENSVISLSVQFFTTASIVQSLWQKSIAPYCAFAALKALVERGNSGTVVDCTLHHHYYRILVTVLNDLNFMLSHVKEVPSIQANLVENQTLFFDKFIECLALFEGMDPTVRKFGNHVEVESRSWSNAYFVYSYLVKVFELCVEFVTASSSRNLLENIIAAVVKAILKDAVKTYNYTTLSNDRSFVEYDIASRPVSFHWPLHRFFCDVTRHANKTGIDVSAIINKQSLELNVPLERSVQMIFEPCLDTLILAGQIESQVWVKNGANFRQQWYCYRFRFSNYSFDLDFIGLQYLASSVDPDHFLRSTLTKYGLAIWAKEILGLPVTQSLLPGYPHPENEAEEDDPHKILSCSERFIQLIFSLVWQRDVGVGENTTIEDVHRQEIIHQLAQSDSSYSALLENMSFPSTGQESALTERVLESVAALTFKNDLSYGVYSLNKELFQTVNPYHYHFSSRHGVTVQERKQKHVNVEKFVPPTKPALLKKNFKPLSNLLICDTLCMLLIRIIKTHMEFKFEEGKKELTSLLLLDQVLYMIVAGLSVSYGDDDTSEQFANKFGLLTVDGETTCSILLKLKPSLSDLQKSIVTWIIDNFSVLGNEALKKEVEEKNQTLQQESILLRKKKAMAARARQMAIMKDFANRQQSFLENNASLLGDIDMDDDEKEDDTYVEMATCILCQEEGPLYGQDKPFGLAVEIQPSNVLNTVRKKVYHLENGAGTEKGVYISGCGHEMHMTCYERYRSTRINRLGTEILCPLCKNLCDWLIPLDKKKLGVETRVIHYKGNYSKDDVDRSISQWVEALSSLPKAIQYLNNGTDGDSPQPLDVDTLKVKTLWNHQANRTDQTKNDRVIRRMNHFAKLITKKMATNIVVDDVISKYFAVSNSLSYTVCCGELSSDLGEPIWKLSTRNRFETLNYYVQFIRSYKDMLDPNVHKFLIRSMLVELGGWGDIDHKVLLNVQDFTCSQILTTDIFYFFVKAHFLFPFSNVEKTEFSQHTDVYSANGLMGLLLVAFIVQQMTLVMNASKPLILENIPLNLDKDRVDMLWQLFTVVEKTMLLKKKCDISKEALFIFVISRSLTLLRKFCIFSEIVDLPLHTATEKKTEETPHGKEIFHPLQTPSSTTGSSTLMMNESELFAVVDSETKAIRTTNDFQKILSEFDSTIEYLKIPSLKHLFVQPAVSSTSPLVLDGQYHSLIVLWCDRYKESTGVKASIDDFRRTVSHYSTKDDFDMAQPSHLLDLGSLLCISLHVPAFVSLNERFDDLHRYVTETEVCRSSHRSPAKCLICGDVVCLECSNKRVFLRHIEKCEDNAGAYLNIEKCTVKLNSRNDFMSIKAPYLDKHGEPDPGLKRGDPLKLSLRHYQALYKHYLDHEIRKQVIQPRRERE